MKKVMSNFMSIGMPSACGCILAAAASARSADMPKQTLVRVSEWTKNDDLNRHGMFFFLHIG